MEKIINILQDTPLFLAGAGVSVGSPSNLKTAKHIKELVIENLIDNLYEEYEEVFIRSKSSKKLGAQLKKIRFEALLQILQDNIDPNLDILEFIEKCDKQNLNHLFLANFIARGSFVITVNFDSLIESALKKRIIPELIVDDIEFKEVYSKLVKLRKNEDGYIFKIHGTLRDLNGYDKRESIKATLRQVSQSGYKFKLEHGKAKVFTHLLENYDLVVIGYSGSDDFDIIPTLLEIKSNRRITWFKHDETKKEPEILTFEYIEKQRKDTVNKILLKMVSEKKRYKDNILKIEGNTEDIIKKLYNELSFSDSPNEGEYNLDYVNYFRTWSKNKVKKEDSLFIVAQILYGLNKWNDAGKIYEMCLEIFNKSNNLLKYCNSLANLGLIYARQSKWDCAIRSYSECKEIYEKKKIDNRNGYSTVLIRLGVAYTNQNKLKDAAKLFKNAIKIKKKLKNQRWEAMCLANLGIVYAKQCKWNIALIYFEKSIKKFKKIGDSYGYSKSLANLGIVYAEKGMWGYGLELLKESMEIKGAWDDLQEYSGVIMNIGIVYARQAKWDKAIEFFKRSRRISIKLGDLWWHSKISTNLDFAYLCQRDRDKAIECFEGAKETFLTQPDIHKYELPMTSLFKLVYIYA